MTSDRAILALAGFMVMLSTLLAVTVSLNWLYLTGFVGLNLFQSAFTGFCPAGAIFRKLGLKPGCSSC